MRSRTRQIWDSLIQRQKVINNHSSTNAHCPFREARAHEAPNTRALVTPSPSQTYEESPQIESSLISCRHPSTWNPKCQAESRDARTQRDAPVHPALPRRSPRARPRQSTAARLRASRSRPSQSAFVSGPAQWRQRSSQLMTRTARTMHSNEGSRYGMRRSSSCGRSFMSWPFIISKISVACSSSASACRSPSSALVPLPRAHRGQGVPWEAS